MVDLDTEDYIEYSSAVGRDELAVERRGTGFFASARQDTMTRIYPDDREMFLAWFTKENIIRELDAQGVFTSTYRLIDTGETGVCQHENHPASGRKPDYTGREHY